MLRLREVHGTDVLVSLMEPHEYVELGIPDLFTVAHACHIRTRHLPIVDTRTPDPAQAAAVDELVEAIHDDLVAGKHVVIHCRGGHGRTGTVAALALLSFGLGPEEAIKTVREAQPKALENAAQTAYVAQTASRWAKPAGQLSHG